VAEEQLTDNCKYFCLDGPYPKS